MHSHMNRVSRGVTGIILAWSVSAWAAGPDLRLVAAAQERNIAGMKALISEGVDVNTRRADGATALFWAAHWDDAEAMDMLLRAHARVNISDDHGVTPLDLACENGDAAIVKKLLAAGADAKHAQSNGVTPLATAARTGNVA